MIKRALISIVIMLVVITGAVAVVVTRQPGPGETVEVVIASGASTQSTAKTLEAKGIIDSVLQFRFWSRIRGMDGRIRAGRYQMALNSGPRRALDILAAGPVVKTTSITIPEGYTVRQVAERFAKKTKITAEDFLAVANSGEVTTPFAGPGGSLEGFLFPETYTLTERDDAAVAVQRMVDTFKKKTADLDFIALKDRGITEYQALIVASLIEREAKVDEDRPKVAAVIYNRLKKSMRLQIDITALYDAPHKVPTRADLKRESPYNTYLNDGLPPTPIANPGLASIRAALQPADIPALYYVLVDKAGHHGFANTFEEFQRLRRSCPRESCG